MPEDIPIHITTYSYDIAKTAIVRPAIEADISAMLRLQYYSHIIDYAGRYGLTVAHFQSQWDIETIEEKRQNWQAQIENSPHSTHVAQIGKQVVGFSIANGHECTAHYVDIALRKRGIGSALLLQTFGIMQTYTTKAMAQEAGGHPAENSSNQPCIKVPNFLRNSIRFYRARGFQITSEKLPSFQDKTSSLQDCVLVHTAGGIAAERQTLATRLGLAGAPSPDESTLVHLQRPYSRRRQQDQ